MRIMAVCWNEEKMILKWYTWYKMRFPDAEFIIYDNESTDDSIKVAKELGIEIRTFNTDNKFDDRVHRDLKNRDFNCGWVIFGDLDELVDINPEIIERERCTIFRFKGFDIMEDRFRFRNPRMDKSICWNSTLVMPNFDYGAHNCRPTGEVKWSSKEYELLHYKYFSEDEYINRCLKYAERFEEWNKGVGHGKEYFFPEQELREKYRNLKEKAKKHEKLQKTG